MLSILASFREQSKGTVTIGGEAPFENARIMEQVCFIQESGYMAESINVRDTLKLAASCWPNWDTEYAQRLIKQYELSMKKRVSSLSRGMKSALGVILCAECGAAYDIQLPMDLCLLLAHLYCDFCRPSHFKELQCCH
ncbi:hypothetical protein MRBLPE1_006272 [Paenibacillus sp. LPE1-1-1.1]